MSQRERLAVELWGSARVELAVERYDLGVVRDDLLLAMSARLDLGIEAFRAWSAELPERDLDIVIATFAGHAVASARRGRDRILN